MVNKIMVAVMCLALLSGFKWGSDNDDRYESEDRSQPATSATMSKVDPQAIKTAAAILGSGTEEEKQMRLESLKRLAEAMKSKNG